MIALWESPHNLPGFISITEHLGPAARASAYTYAVSIFTRVPGWGGEWDQSLACWLVDKPCCALCLKAPRWASLEKGAWSITQKCPVEYTETLLPGSTSSELACGGYTFTHSQLQKMRKRNQSAKSLLSFSLLTHFGSSWYLSRSLWFL